MSLSIVDAAVPAPVGTETCVACGSSELEPFLDLGQVPVATTSLYRTRAEAMQTPRGRMVLGQCPRCGLVRNVAFDPESVAYTTEYENSQHFSPTFQRYAEQLAGRLIDAYGLRGATVADIGCGKGEFLALLCERAEARGLGFDPTYDGEVDGSERIEIRREFFPGGESSLDVQLVVCRHVLEHLAAPDALLETVVGSLAGPVPVYFEVPNAEHVFSPSGMWDLIYQHVSYFGERSVRALFARCGFEVTGLDASFDGQFLSIDAVPGEHVPDLPTPRSERSAPFTEIFRDTLDRWERFAERHQDREVTLWGAGAKGVSFLNLTPVGQIVDAVVDINPRKQGAHVPGTGQAIIDPSSLAEISPEVVVVANPLYEAEIVGSLERLGLTCEVFTL
ncbi:MAG: class I SAM-dependent methyltransferase [Actinobacteria bacterium]|nr:class I SAM-dependent methyltransferase [Actinomycetota bacterium]